jgi:hypothetical protein
MLPVSNLVANLGSRTVRAVVGELVAEIADPRREIAELKERRCLWAKAILPQVVTANSLSSSCLLPEYSG